MSLWAISVLARRWTRANYLSTNHGAGVVEAESRDAAIGKVMRIARKVFPSSDGWQDHDAVVQSADIVVEPEEACRFDQH